MNNVYDIVGFCSRSDTPYGEESLQDTYIILDFMPDPPELPELCQE